MTAPPARDIIGSAPPAPDRSPEVRDQVDIGAALPKSKVKAQKVKAQETQAISPPKSPGPVQLDSLRTARTLGVLTRRMEPHLTPTALHELRSNAQLVAVLCGEMTMAKVTAEGKSGDDLKAVANCLALTSPQNLAVLDDPHNPGQLLVLNKARINLDIPEVRWGLRLAPESWSPEAARKAERLNEEGQPHALACLAATREVGQPLTPSGNVPRQVGMISYVDSAEGVQRFASVLREWRENVEDFGHRNVLFRLCDDSPEPYATQIRTLLQQQPNEAVQFAYTGPPEKALLRERLEKGLANQLSQQDARQVAALMAGPGATQNRNLSLQLLGKAGGLQMDHDMTPEVLSTHWEDPIPFDILGQLQSHQHDYGIRSLSFTGAHDVSIEHILAADHGMTPRRIGSQIDAFMGNSVRGPMFIPSNVPSAARIAPGLRDGDLALTEISQKVTSFGVSALAESIYHRDQAGGRWSGGHLVRQYLLFEFCNQAVKSWVDEADEGDAVKVGQALLRGLEQPSAWTTVGDSSFFERTQSAVQTYYNNLPVDHPERQRIQEQLFLDPQQEMDPAKLDASLHQEARSVLRTQALALIHNERIAEILEQAQEPGLATCLK